MIQAKITPTGVELSGHAGYAPAGQDIVCAGVSTLVHTLALALDDHGQLQTAEMRDGYTLIVANVPDSPYLDFAETGLAVLAKHFPKNVSVFSCREGREKR